MPKTRGFIRLVPSLGLLYCLAGAHEVSTVGPQRDGAWKGAPRHSTARTARVPQGRISALRDGEARPSASTGGHRAWRLTARRFPRQPPRLQGNAGRRCQCEAGMLRGGTGLGGTSAPRWHRGTQGSHVPTAAGRGESHFQGDKGAVPRPTQQPHSPPQQPLLEGRVHQPTSPTQQPPRCSGSSKMGSGQRCLHTHPRAQPTQHSPRARSHPHAAVCPRATHTCAHVCTPLGHSCTHTIRVNRV